MGSLRLEYDNFIKTKKKVAFAEIEETNEKVDIRKKPIKLTKDKTREVKDEFRGQGFIYSDEESRKINKSYETYTKKTAEESSSATTDQSPNKESTEVGKTAPDGTTELDSKIGNKR